MRVIWRGLDLSFLFLPSKASYLASHPFWLMTEHCWLARGGYLAGGHPTLHLGLLLVLLLIALQPIVPIPQLRQTVRLPLRTAR